MRRLQAMLLGGLLAGLPLLSAIAAPQWAAMEGWVGLYPTRDEGAKPRRLFEVPELATKLKLLLPDADLALLKSFEVEKPVELREGYIVIGVCRAHDCGNQNATVVLSQQTGDAWVGLLAAKKGKVTNRVFATSPWNTLPISVKSTLLKD